MINDKSRFGILIITLIAVVFVWPSCGDKASGPTTVPARPEYLDVTPLSPSMALVQWDDQSDNEDSFAVYRAESGPFAHIASMPANVNAMVDSLLDDSTDYRYYVVAVNALGSSAPSETVSVTTPALGAAPLAPRFPSPADDSAGVPVDVVLMWQCADPDGDTLTYDLYFGAGEYLELLDSDLDAAAYVIDSLEYEELYNWKVVAYDDDRHRTEGPVWHFTTAPLGGDTSFALIVERSGQGHVTVDPDLPRFAYGDTVTLTAIPDGGWYFWGWTGGTTSSDAALTLIMSRDWLVIANFEEVADSTTSRIRGTVTWPGHQLSLRTYSFADTQDANNTPFRVAQADVDPGDGQFELVIADQADTLLLEFTAHDDVNGNGEWDPIDPVDGWGRFDPDGDGPHNGFFEIAPGTHMDSVRIVLRSADE